MSQLRTCANRGELHRITQEDEIDAILDKLMAQAWVVYSKPCLEAGDRVIDCPTCHRPMRIQAEIPPPLVRYEGG